MHASTEMSVETFEQLLQDMYAHLQQFSEMLDVEKSLLEKNDTIQLDNNLVNKRAIIESLDAISAQCQHFFQASTSAFSETAILNMIAKADYDKQRYLTTLWHNVKALLKECDRKNLVNGIVITTLRNYSNHLLNILTNRPKDDVYSNQLKKHQSAISTREHKA